MIVTSVNPKMTNGPYWSNASDRVSDDDRAKNSSDEDDEEEDEIEEEADDRGNKRVQLSTLQDARIRVGRDYQATATPHIPPEERKEDDSTERELLVWSPSSDANWEEVDEFLTVAKDKYGYSIEQALGLLLWRKHSIDSAKEALAEFSPLPDEWSPHDKLLFETAFEFHGKHFKRLQQMLPDKTIASLVKYYYSWKKSRLRVSYIDKEMEKLVGRGSTDPAVKQSLDLLKVVSSEENTDQKKRGRTHRGLSRGTVGTEFSASFQAGKDENKVDETSCMNCWININIPHQTPFGSLCASCYKHWWVTGNHRPLGANEKEENGESKMKVEGPGNSSDVKTRIPLRPPPGIYINHDDLLTIGNQKFEENLDTLKKLDEKIRSLREKAQKQKQWLAMNDHKSQLKDSEFFDLQAMLEVEGLDDKDERESEQTEDNVDSDGGNGSSNNGSTTGNNGSNGKKEEVETNGGRTLRARQRWTKNDRLVLIEGFKRFGMNLSRIASLLPNRSERDLLYFLNNAQANGYSGIMINAVKSYESLHGSIPGSDKLRSLILGRWSLPLSGSSTPKSKGSPKPTVKSVV